MSLVKEYKGVYIYVSAEGEFYCDANTNSNNYKNKTFVSKKLQSIEKAIDDFKGQEIDGNRYYHIDIHYATLTPLKVIRKVGSRLFFDDGTDTSNYLRTELYPKTVDEKQEFKDLEILFEQLKENRKELKKLYETQNKLRDEAVKKLNCMQKVRVC